MGRPSTLQCLSSIAAEVLSLGLGVTDDRLARVLGVERPHVSMWRSNARTMPGDVPFYLAELAGEEGTRRVGQWFLDVLAERTGVRMRAAPESRADATGRDALAESLDVVKAAADAAQFIGRAAADGNLDDAENEQAHDHLDLLEKQAAEARAALRPRRGPRLVREERAS